MWVSFIRKFDFSSFIRLPKSNFIHYFLGTLIIISSKPYRNSSNSCFDQGDGRVSQVASINNPHAFPFQVRNEVMGFFLVFNPGKLLVHVHGSDPFQKIYRQRDDFHRVSFDRHPNLPDLIQVEIIMAKTNMNISCFGF